jgi:ERCC4-type nuclease
MTTIIVDSREKEMIDKTRQRLKQKKLENKIDIQVEALDVGDFLVISEDESKFLFERKTLSDFQNSVIDNRIWSQLHRLQNKILNDEVDRVGLAITNFYFNKYTKSNIIYGALGSIYQRFDNDVLFFRTNPQFLDFLFKISRKPKSKLKVKPEYLIQPLLGSLDGIEEIDINVKLSKRRSRKDILVETKEFPININFLKK